VSTPWCACRQLAPQHFISRGVLEIGLLETKHAQRFSQVGGAVKSILLTQSAQCRYGQTGSRIHVSEIVPKSPAEESREVRVGDILLSVDGQQVQGMHLDSVNRLIAGSVGSSVNLEFQHEDGSTSRISFTRREIYRS
jgi:C-terminal processing protease CtpA/Prc